MNCRGDLLAGAVLCSAVRCCQLGAAVLALLAGADVFSLGVDVMVAADTPLSKERVPIGRKGELRRGKPNCNWLWVNHILSYVINGVGSV